jgi:hypothetical protein
MGTRMICLYRDINSRTAYVQSLPPCCLDAHSPCPLQAIQKNQGLLDGVPTFKFQVLVLQIRPCLLHAPRLRQQIRLSLAVLACVAAGKRPGSRNLGSLSSGVSAGLKSLEKLDNRFGSKIFVVVVVDLNHGGIDTGAEALDLDKGEQAV